MSNTIYSSKNISKKYMNLIEKKQKIHLPNIKEIIAQKE